MQKKPKRQPFSSAGTRNRSRNHVILSLSSGWPSGSQRRPTRIGFQPSAWLTASPAIRLDSCTWRLISLTDEVNELLPAIRSAGYTVQGVDLDVALPPKVSVHCKLQTDLSADERAALLATLEGRALASAAVSSLFQVAEAQRRMSLGTLQPTDVILEVGVSPAVRVRYREPGAAAAS